MTLKIITYQSLFLSFLTFASRKDLFRTFFGVFRGGTKMTSSDVTFNVAFELSQPIGKTEFFSNAKNRTNSVS